MPIINRGILKCEC